MKLYIAKDEYENVYAYTSKKRMLRDANANDFCVQEPIQFNLTKWVKRIKEEKRKSVERSNKMKTKNLTF